jgi:hypothetical protein
MEKILTIDGRQVKFKSTGAFLMRYKAQFGRDALKDIYKMQKAVNSGNGAIDSVDLEIFLNLVWTLAKTADSSIDPPMEWLDTFETFPLFDIMSEIINLIFSCLFPEVESKKKRKQRRFF